MSSRTPLRLQLCATACLVTGLLAAPWPAAAGALALRAALTLTAPTLTAAAPAYPPPSARGPLALTPAVSLNPPTARNEPEQTTNTWLHEAVTLHRQGRLTAAAEAYRQALTEPDAPPAGHLGLARLLALAQGPAAAARYLSEAHARAPDPALALEAGRWWAAAGEAELASAWLERAHPVHSAGDSALLAALHLLAGRHEQAVAAYRLALRQPPGRAAWWLGLGLSLQALGDDLGARAAYQQALAGGDLPDAVNRHIATLLEQIEG